jgi:hypothetical protein
MMTPPLIQDCSGNCVPPQLCMQESSGVCLAPGLPSFTFTGCTQACSLPPNAADTYVVNMRGENTAVAGPSLDIRCRENYGGVPVAVCDRPGGQLDLSGCTANQCVSFSGDRRNYSASGGRETGSLARVTDLGNVSCADGCTGTARVVCSSVGGTFTFSGCVETLCTLPRDKPSHKWITVLKTNGDATFGYDSPHWSSRSSTLNPSSDRRQPGNAKYPEYNTEPLDAVMGCVGDLSTCMPPHVFSQPIPNAASLFGGAYRAEGVNASAMLSAFKPVGQRDCAPQRAGFNTQCSDGNAARWGYCNNVPSQPCQSDFYQDADGVIGIGIRGAGETIGAGWTPFFVANVNDVLLRGRRQVWIMVRVPQQGQPMPPVGYVVTNPSGSYRSALGQVSCAPSFSNPCSAVTLGRTFVACGSSCVVPPDLGAGSRFNGCVHAARGETAVAMCNSGTSDGDIENFRDVATMLAQMDECEALTGLGFRFFVKCNGYCVPRDSCPEYTFEGCMPNFCRLATGKVPAGYTVSRPNATTVASLGAVHCAKTYVGTPIIVCDLSNYYRLSGCEPICTSESGDRTGYIAEHESGTTVEALGALYCATNYHGFPAAACVAGGNFTFRGCTQSVCVPGSGDRLGYTAENPLASVVGDFGSLSCSPEYTGKAAALCPEVGGAFQFQGCVEKRCHIKAEVYRQGYDLSHMFGVSPQGVIVDLRTLVTESGGRDCLASSLRCYGTLRCAKNYVGNVSATCFVDGGDFVFMGCKPTCKPRSGHRRGFVMTTPTAVTVDGLGTVSCNTSFSSATGAATAQCPIAGGEFNFSGCKPMCASSSIRSELGYITSSSPTATLRSDQLSGFSCTRDYEGTPVANCKIAGGLFELSGCTERRCVIVEPHPGYVIEFPNTSTVAALGNLACARSFLGEPVATCAGGGANFVLAGCVENRCTASSVAQRTGYVVPSPESSTVSSLGVLSCAQFFVGKAVAACDVDGGQYALEGCETTCNAGSGDRTGVVVQVAHGTTVSELGDVACHGHYFGNASVICRPTVSDGWSGGSACTVAPEGIYGDGQNVTVGDVIGVSGGYRPFSDCKWTVECGSGRAQLRFNSFDLGFFGDSSGQFDFVTVYDGPNSSAPVLATFHAENVPSVQAVTGRYMHVEFHSDGFQERDGFSAIVECPERHLFAFDGCHENPCSAASAVASGYLTAHASGTTVSSLADVSCAAGYSLADVGGPRVACPRAGGNFVFQGCANACLLPADSTGYAVATHAMVSVYELQIVCATNYAGNATATCNVSAGEFTLSNCIENTCVSGSGKRAGYVASATASRVSELSTVCDSSYRGVPIVRCPRPCLYRNASGPECAEFQFQGCHENDCLPVLQAPVGYRIETANVTRVSALGNVSCDTNWYGSAKATCASPGSRIYFHGCVETTCIRMSGARDGYLVAEPAATTVRSLGQIVCDSFHFGLATAECARPGGQFVFKGCRHNNCAMLSGDRTGYVVEHNKSMTVPGLGALQCSTGYVGTAIVTCAFHRGQFQFSGCASTCMHPPFCDNATHFCVPGYRFKKPVTLCRASTRSSSSPCAMLGLDRDFSLCGSVCVPALIQDLSVMDLGDVSCADKYAGVARVTCPTAGKEFVLHGCEPACIAGSGIRMGYIASVAATTVSTLGVVRCATNYDGTPRVTCHAGAEFSFEGCSENRCVPGSGIRTGYATHVPLHRRDGLAFVPPLAEKVSTLGILTCAPNYHGHAQAFCSPSCQPAGQCDFLGESAVNAWVMCGGACIPAYNVPACHNTCTRSAGAHFRFGGCSENLCMAGSGRSALYGANMDSTNTIIGALARSNAMSQLTAAAVAAVTQSALRDTVCTSQYPGNANVACPVHGEQFIYSGCNTCTLPSSTVGYTIQRIPTLDGRRSDGAVASSSKGAVLPTLARSTIASLGSVRCATNYGGRATVGCAIGTGVDKVTSVGSSVLAGDFKWQGGVLAADGRVFGVPYMSSSVLIFNPSTGSTDTGRIGGFATFAKWFGGVLSPTGKIFCTPFTAESVLVIDPSKNAASSLDFDKMPQLIGRSKWSDSVLARNGLIYLVPFLSTTVLRIDPVAATATAVPNSISLVGIAKWFGGVLARNGLIYCIPFDARWMLVIDPSTDRIMSQTGQIGSSPRWNTQFMASGKWAGGVLAPNGKIYGMPSNAESVLILAPAELIAGQPLPEATNFPALAALAAVDTSSIVGQVGEYVGGRLAANGRIYAIPSTSQSGLVIDTALDAADNPALGALAGSERWARAALAPNGHIYGMPSNADAVLHIIPAAGTEFVFEGCTENICKVGSGTRAGYSVENSQASTVSGLGTVTCQQGYRTTIRASVTCDQTAVERQACAAVDMPGYEQCGGCNGQTACNFTFHGCEPICQPATAALMRGYRAATPDATTVSALGALGCADSFGGEAAVTCAGVGGLFTFTGCMELSCLLPPSDQLLNYSGSWITESLSVDHSQPRTMSSLGDLRCANGYDGVPTITCHTGSGSSGENLQQFRISGCVAARTSDAIITLALQKDMAQIDASPASRAAFEADFAAAVGLLAQVDPARVVIDRIQGGSVLVLFRILGAMGSHRGALSAADAVQRLQSSLSDGSGGAGAGAALVLGGETVPVVGTLVVVSAPLAVPPEPEPEPTPEPEPEPLPPSPVDMQGDEQGALGLVLGLVALLVAVAVGGGAALGWRRHTRRLREAEAQRYADESSGSDIESVAGTDHRPLSASERAKAERAATKQRMLAKLKAQSSAKALQLEVRKLKRMKLPELPARPVVEGGDLSEYGAARMLASRGGLKTPT